MSWVRSGIVLENISFFQLKLLLRFKFVIFHRYFLMVDTFSFGALFQGHNACHLLEASYETGRT
jgi:hypothetical protein